MFKFSLGSIQINKEILNDNKYDYLFSVEEVNKLVQNGIPFRDAYKNVGKKIAEGDFKPDKKVDHTHVGSISNLALKEITRKMEIANKE